MTPSLSVTQLRMCREYGGAERYVIDLCAQLHHRGYRQQLIVLPGSPLAEREHEISVPMVHAAIRGDANLAAMGRVARILRDGDAQLLSVHDGTIPCALGAHLAGIPAVATVHGFRHKWNYLAADHLIAVSEAVRTHLIARGLPARRITTVRNGVDTSYFSVRDQAAARQALGLAPDLFYFVATSRLVPKKGIGLLLEAFKGIVALAPHARLLIAGTGSEEAAMRALAQQLGLSATVTFLGFVADIRPLLAAMDCHVLPSLIEPLGLAELEAMASGHPSIATDSGGPREVITDRETGIIIEVGSIPQLYEAMRHAVQHPTWVHEAGLAAREHVVAHHSLGRQVDEIEAVYQQVLAARAR